MFEYAVKELGYSEDAAYRRINAMRLVKELPQLESKIADGTLSLSNIGTATQVFRAESKASGAPVLTERKLEMLVAIENKSRREAEAIVQKMTTAPKEMIRPETIRVIDDHIELRMTAGKSFDSGVIRKAL